MFCTHSPCSHVVVVVVQLNVCVVIKSRVFRLTIKKTMHLKNGELPQEVNSLKHKYVTGVFVTLIVAMG